MFAASGRFPAAPGGRPVVWAATGRSGGVSLPPFDSLNLASHVGDDLGDVEHNRRAVAQALGASAIAAIRAEHGATVATVSDDTPPGPCDALVTSTPGLALLALGADCAVIAIVGTRRVAVVHCGWRGLVADVVGAAVGAVRTSGEIRGVVIGPAICGECYPVPQERADEVMVSAAAGPGVVVMTPDGQPGIDVRAGVVTRLASLGIASDVIAHAGGCTAERADLFSFRRDGETGRHGMLVMIEQSDGLVA